jgi:hypothetical protein
MTDTPRTNRAALHDGTVVPVEFAQGLEREIYALRDQLEAWREVAGMLAASLAAGASSVHPSAYHFRGTALEAYERLKNNGAGIEL